MMTIIHTSDWHLGQTFFGHNRENEHAAFLEWLYKTLSEEQADALLISGDIFDVSNPSASSLKLFYSFLQKITTDMPHLQIIITAGNHDSPSRLETPLPLLEGRNIIIKGEVPKKSGIINYEDLIIPLYNKDKEIEAYCLAVPYLRQGDYPRVDSNNPYTAGVEELYKELYRYVEPLKKEYGIIAMGHLQAIGSDIAKVDYSEKMIIGGLEAVSPSIFSKFNYTALGHIHKAQRLNKNEHIRYAGSPLPMSFAEKNYKHGVVKVVLNKTSTISIERLAYNPPIKLLSIPDKGSAKPDEILTLIDQIPNKESENREEINQYPYLEIRVLLSEPEPLLAKHIGDKIDTKRVRLARIVNDFKREDDTTNLEELNNEGLDQLRPSDIANRHYKSIYKEEMPPKLEELFHEACMNININR